MTEYLDKDDFQSDIEVFKNQASIRVSSEWKAREGVQLKILVHVGEKNRRRSHKVETGFKMW